MSDAWGVLLALCGAIITVGGAVAVIVKLLSPVGKLSKQLQAMEKFTYSNLALFRAVLALLDYNIYNESTEDLKAARAALNEQMVVLANTK